MLKITKSPNIQKMYDLMQINVFFFVRNNLRPYFTDNLVNWLMFVIHYIVRYYTEITTANFRGDNLKKNTIGMIK